MNGMTDTVTSQELEMARVVMLVMQAAKASAWGYVPAQSEENTRAEYLMALLVLTDPAVF